MANKFSRNTMKITQIYNGFNDESYIVDPSYQRRKVWGLQDNVRLIETILLDLVIPEIFMWDYETDPNTGKTITHIVDGQQRINAIFEYISGNFKLQKKYLLDDGIISKYADKFFAELDDESKKTIWSYEMSIVNLDKNFSIDEVRNMFYRLNLTDYSLNEQEKRKSLASAFGQKAEELANEDFWQNYKVFSPSDIRRMRDVEYSSSIILLAREGIVDQTKSDRLDQIYKDYSEEYKDADDDLNKIHDAMDLIKKLTKGKTNGFVNKKTQMYSLFSVMFDFSENKISITEKMIEVMEKFIECYSIFKNEYEINSENADEQQMIEFLKRYKLASSEGVNKLNNRMIRFEILKKILLEETDVSTKTMSIVGQKMYLLAEEQKEID